jgi:ribosomal RNA-processing protein 36
VVDEEMYVSFFLAVAQSDIEYPAEQKKLLLRARYDALAAAKGPRAVKKAIEKKQKKISQKDKKARPFSASQSTGSRKRGHPEEGGRPEKRRRTG